MEANEIIAHCKQRIAKGDAVQFHKAVLELAVKEKYPGTKKDDEEPEEKKLPANVYQPCIGIYKEFLERHGLSISVAIDSRQGKHMKNIIMKLKRASKQKSNEGIIRSWEFILKNWDRVGHHIGTQKKLSQIDSNLLEILDKIRNGATKRDSRKTEAEQLAIQLEARRQQRTQ